jgi:pyridoxal phosphate enzyme (YggS family)
MIEENIKKIRAEICEYERKYQRDLGSVNLLAVSKQQSSENILAAVAAGQRAFGENYLQEALQKITVLADQDLIWHFIGPIQSNKTKKIAENFAWVQSVSDAKIAERLNKQRPGHLPALNICLQINISQELTKSGVMAGDVYSLAEYCAKLPNLILRGLMAIPEPKNTFAEQSIEFHKLRLLFEALRKKYSSVDTLSIGMSADLAAAIAEGSTMVRIGTKIFGER